MKNKLKEDQPQSSMSLVFEDRQTKRVLSSVPVEDSQNPHILPPSDKFIWHYVRFDYFQALLHFVLARRAVAGHSPALSSVVAASRQSAAFCSLIFRWRLSPESRYAVWYSLRGRPRLTTTTLSAELRSKRTQPVRNEMQPNRYVCTAHRPSQTEMRAPVTKVLLSECYEAMTANQTAWVA